MKFLAYYFIFGIVFVETVSVLSQEEPPCNEYVDTILRDLKADKEIFQDPYIIPERSYEVHKKILFVNYTGEASIYDGFVYGLQTLHRDGDVIVDRQKKTHLKIYLGAGELKMQCSGKIKFMGQGPQVRVDAKIAYVNMKLDIVPSEKGTNPKIVNFKLEDVKGNQVKVSGMGPLNFFLNSYMRFISVVFRNLVKLGIEGRMKGFLDKKLKDYEIPEECLDDGMRFFKK